MFKNNSSLEWNSSELFNRDIKDLEHIYSGHDIYFYITPNNLLLYGSEPTQHESDIKIFDFGKIILRKHKLKKALR